MPMTCKYDKAKAKKASKLLMQACKFRDRLYKMDKKLWTKAAKKFDRGRRMLIKAGDPQYAELTKACITACLRRAGNSW